MRRREILMGLPLLLGGCAALGPEPAPPEVPAGGVTGLHVRKGERRLRLLKNGDVVRDYRIGLGFAPVGPKRALGDGRTPEGLYRIDRRNPQSAFHLSLGISYPSPQDSIRAWSAGHSPGGAIVLHGSPNGMKPEPTGDWTWGCITVRNAEIEAIWRLVPTGCPILIEA